MMALTVPTDVSKPSRDVVLVTRHVTGPTRQSPSPCKPQLAEKINHRLSVMQRWNEETPVRLRKEVRAVFRTLWTLPKPTGGVCVFEREREEGSDRVIDEMMEFHQTFVRKWLVDNQPAASVWSVILPR